MHRSKTASLFDHLVGTGEQHRWHFEAERFRSLEIDTQLEFGRVGQTGYLPDWHP